MRWLFSIRFHVINIDEEIWLIWIPVIVPLIISIIWIYPRMNILVFRKNSFRGRLNFTALASLTIAAMLIVSQDYFTTATGKLVTLPDITAFNKAEDARYYKINEYYVDANYRGAYASSNVSGRYNRDLNFDVYFVFPIINDSGEVEIKNNNCWYGIKYHKRISNRLNRDEKNKQYRAFLNDCTGKTGYYDFYSADHFE